MNWVITADVESPYATYEGIGVVDRTFGAHALTDDLLAGLPLRFRVLDDDGIPYYAGQADKQGFDPLDWARANAGCTEIQFAKGESWETL